MNVHELKSWPLGFGDIRKGRKRYEIRFNDRDFKPGDVLWLRLYNPNTKEYGDQSELVRVNNVRTTQDIPAGLADGYVIMDVDRVKLEQA